MGIGKGKSDKINIDGLIESTNNESKILQVERSFTENIAELKQTTAVLNAAIDRMESIVSKFNSSAQEHLYELCCGSRSATYGSS